jgi:hypothetical protein
MELTVTLNAFKSLKIRFGSSTMVLTNVKTFEVAVGILHLWFDSNLKIDISDTNIYTGL